MTIQIDDPGGILAPLLFFFVIAPTGVSLGILAKMYTGKEHDRIFRKGTFVALATILSILERRFPFYHELKPRYQRLFAERVDKFLRNTSFEGREGLELTDEMVVLISATSIRMSWGFAAFILDSFPTILVYPAAYYSPFTRSMNKGETNPHGIMAFAWRSFEREMEVPDDGLNLGYHEFAHAMLLESMHTGFGGNAFDFGYQEFSRAIAEDHLDRYAHASGIFREYAFSNKMEFFAVGSEMFFEDPQLLNEQCPDLYRIFTRTYNQDPIWDRKCFI